MTKPRKMSRENPASIHVRSFWQAQAGNPRLFLWHRVYAYAYGAHRENGHTPCKPRELALAVAVVDVKTGEIVEPSSNRISEAIRICVDYGFLDPQSTASCLIVPSGITGGLVGRATDQCTHRHARRSASTGRSGAKPDETFRLKRNVIPLQPEHESLSPARTREPSRDLSHPTSGREQEPA